MATELLISHAEVLQRVDQIARVIKTEVPNVDELILIGVLVGASTFIDYLTQALYTEGVDVTKDFVRYSSYGERTESTGFPMLVSDINPKTATHIKGHSVILGDDIWDTGHTLWAAKQRLKLLKPSFLGLTTLLSKPARHVATLNEDLDIDPRLVGFEIPDHFVFGEGIDKNGKHGRGAQGIWYEK